MSHSGGFEDRIVQLFGDEVADMQPYAEILSRELPDRVRAPGTVSTYSNHGVGLAGLVLEEVSGEKWGDYVQQHILDPLQMSSATAFQPVPWHWLKCCGRRHLQRIQNVLLNIVPPLLATDLFQYQPRQPYAMIGVG